MSAMPWDDETDAALADAAQRYLQQQYRFDERLKRSPVERRFDRRVWRDLVAQGWCSVAADEALGGLGYRPSSVVLLAACAGESLLQEPFVGAGVVPMRLLGACVQSDERDRLLAAAMHGGSLVAANVMYPLTAVAASQTTITAEIPWMLDGDIADTLLLPVEGGGLGVVPRDAAGVSVRPLPLVDGRGAASVTLNGALVRWLMEADSGAMARALADARLLAALATAADSVGVMRRTLALTLEYLKTRRQFGVPLGGHQVLQHRAVDMYIRLEESDCLVRQAIRHQMRTGSLDAAQVHAAKSVACESARLVTQEAIQLHGGIGVTEEYAASHYLRRARVNEQLYGSGEQHFQAFAAATDARA